MQTQSMNHESVGVWRPCLPLWEPAARYGKWHQNVVSFLNHWQLVLIASCFMVGGPDLGEELSGVALLTLINSRFALGWSPGASSRPDRYKSWRWDQRSTMRTMASTDQCSWQINCFNFTDAQTCERWLHTVWTQHKFAYFNGAIPWWFSLLCQQCAHYCLTFQSQPRSLYDCSDRLERVRMEKTVTMSTKQMHYWTEDLACAAKVRIPELSKKKSTHFADMFFCLWSFPRQFARKIHIQSIRNQSVYRCKFVF